MSTRAIITFKSAESSHKVYKHCDGYPNTKHGILAALHKAMDLAWPLPRFETDEFSAAFIAATKTSPGGVRVMNPEEDAADAAFRYTVKAHGNTGALKVTWKGYSKGSAIFTRESFKLENYEGETA